MNPVSSMFVSHGAPTLLIEDLPARTFLKEAGRTLGRPEAVVAFSAHSVSDRVVVSSAEKLHQVYDFWGFPSQLYEVRYEPPGSPSVAGTVVKLLEDAHIEVERSSHAGIDHGMWIPLSLMYPDAGVPVVPVTLGSHMDPQRHLQIGEALRPLRDRGVLIIASGGLTHNLREFGMYPRQSAPPGYVAAFADWVEELAHVRAHRGSGTVEGNHPSRCQKSSDSRALHPAVRRAPTSPSAKRPWRNG